MVNMTDTLMQDMSATINLLPISCAQAEENQKFVRLNSFRALRRK